MNTFFYDVFLFAFSLVCYFLRQFSFSFRCDFSYSFTGVVKSIFHSLVFVEEDYSFFFIFWAKSKYCRWYPKSISWNDCTLLRRVSYFLFEFASDYESNILMNCSVFSFCAYFCLSWVNSDLILIKWLKFLVHVYVRSPNPNHLWKKSYLLNFWMIFCDLSTFYLLRQEHDDIWSLKVVPYLYLSWRLYFRIYFLFWRNWINNKI